MWIWVPSSLSYLEDLKFTIRESRKVTEFQGWWSRPLWIWAGVACTSTTIPQFPDPSLQHFPTPNLFSAISLSEMESSQYIMRPVSEPNPRQLPIPVADSRALLIWRSTPKLPPPSMDSSSSAVVSLPVSSSFLLYRLRLTFFLLQLMVGFRGQLLEQEARGHYSAAFLGQL